jgi:nucleoside-diphosphate-sugar epimerase
MLGIMLNYIVTGEAGFIGFYIVEAITGSHEVVVIDNFSRGKSENLSGFPDNVHVIHGRITDLFMLKDAFKGADGIFH